MKMNDDNNVYEHKKINNKNLLIGYLIGGIGFLLIITSIILMTFDKFDNSSKGISNTNNNEKYSDYSILNDITVDGVKLSEVYSLNDFINRFNIEIGTVYIQDAADETYAYVSRKYNDFLNEDLSKIKVGDMFFYLSDDDFKKVVRFYTDYDPYLKNKNNVRYRAFEFDVINNILYINNKNINDFTYRELREFFKTKSGHKIYKEFICKDGKPCSLSIEKGLKEYTISISHISEFKQKDVEEQNNLLSLEEIKNIENKYKDSKNLLNISNIDFDKITVIVGTIENGSFNEGDTVKYVNWNGDIKTAVISKIDKNTYYTNEEPSYYLYLNINDYSMDDSSILFIE